MVEGSHRLPDLSILVLRLERRWHRGYQRYHLKTRLLERTGSGRAVAFPDIQVSSERHGI